MTATATIPRVGGSATYFIGSDAYHEIIVEVRRNGKSVRTYSAEPILKAAGLSLEEWNELSDNDKKFETHKAIFKIQDQFYTYELNWVDGDIARTNANREFWSRTHEFTARAKDGEIFFLLKGETYGELKIGSQYSYRDPHF